MDALGYWLGALLGIGIFSATPAFAVVAACAALFWQERRWRVFLGAYGITVLIVGLVNGAIMIYLPYSDSAFFNVIIGPLVFSALALAGTRKLAAKKHVSGV